MREISVEVIGKDPPCKRCQAALKNVEEAASKLKTSDVEIHVSHLDIASRDVIAKYGVLISPSLVVNSVVKVVGSVPDKEEVERILRAIIK